MLVRDAICTDNATFLNWVFALPSHPTLHLGVMPALPHFTSERLASAIQRFPIASLQNAPLRNVLHDLFHHLLHLSADAAIAMLKTLHERADLSIPSDEATIRAAIPHTATNNEVATIIALMHSSL